MQFGHNDSHAPENPEATDASTTYMENLRRYIDDACAIGATPVLVTPMVRRTFDAQGRVTDAHPPNSRLESYATAMKEVAGEKQVAVIDLYASSKELVEKLGPAASEEMGNKKRGRHALQREWRQGDGSPREAGTSKGSSTARRQFEKSVTAVRRPAHP